MATGALGNSDPVLGIWRAVCMSGALCMPRPVYTVRRDLRQSQALTTD